MSALIERWFGYVLITGWIGASVWGLWLCLDMTFPTMDWWLLAGLGTFCYVVGGAAIQQDKESERCRRPPL